MMFSLWLQNLAAYALQLTLVVSSAALVAALLRLRSPAVRLAFFQLLLLITLGLPLLQNWNQVIVKSSPVALATGSGATVSRTFVRKAPPEHSFPLSATAIWILAAGMLVRSAWLLMGFWTLRQCRQKSSALELPPATAEAQERLGIRAEFRGSGNLTGPITFGLRRPLIVLPASYLNMAVETQQAIVCHELIHVRRRDWLFIVFEELVLTALWFHPAMWWLIGQIRLAREQAVDAEVIRLSTRRRQYVEALLEVARLNQGTRLTPATMFLRRQHLFERAAAILKEHSMSKKRLIASLLAGLCTAVVTVRVGVWLFPLQARAQAQSSAPIQIASGGDNLTFHGPIEYPRQMIERRIEGSVVVEINTDREGGVSDAHVLSGPEELRRLVLSSVLDWRYDTFKHPAGRSVVTIQFQLPAGEIGGRSPVLPAYERGGGLDIERGVYVASTGDTVTLSGQQQRRLLEKLIAERASQSERAASTEERARLERQVIDLKRKLENDRALQTNNDGGPISGRLSSIHTEGLTETTLRQLQSRLPVHLGDEINADTILRIEQALQSIDPRLKMKLESGERGDVALGVVMVGENK